MWPAVKRFTEQGKSRLIQLGRASAPRSIGQISTPFGQETVVPRTHTVRSCPKEPGYLGERLALLAQVALRVRAAVPVDPGLAWSTGATARLALLRC
ncbi:MAG TPA: hypothetical protein VGP82_21750 [Ktedonobacterales bacterium]|nr:hypothetical protein [Ktedonobacterales bacterium]